MKRITIFIFILVCACASTDGVKLKGYKEGKKANYFLALPKGHSQITVHGDRYSETRFTYPNGAVFYFTDDTESGGAINNAKVKEYGDGIFLKIAVSDTVDLEGQSDADKFWREKKMDNIVVGYISADERQKIVFDEVISSLK